MPNYNTPAPSARRRLAPQRRAMSGRLRTPAMKMLRNRMRKLRRRRLRTK